jgi:hypothetical protein
MSTSNKPTQAERLIADTYGALRERGTLACRIAAYRESIIAAEREAAAERARHKMHDLDMDAHLEDVDAVCDAVLDGHPARSLCPNCTNPDCLGSARPELCEHKTASPSNDYNRPAFRIIKDGDQFCAISDDFKNLQESRTGFGGTPQEALAALLDTPASPLQEARDSVETIELPSYGRAYIDAELRRRP